jgi:hypothetical protein
LKIEVGCLLEEAGYSTLRVAAHEVDLSHDMRSTLTQLVGVTELAHQLIRNRKSPFFDRLAPHLGLLVKGAAIQLGYSSDDATNKVFELLAACWVLPLCSDIELDDPVRSAGGTNPDIIATVNGVRWGIACKVLHSTNPAQLITTIEKGVSQVHAANVDRGVVLVSMKNRLLIDDYWPQESASDPNTDTAPVYRVFIDPGMPFQKLGEQLSDFVMATRTAVGLPHMETVLCKEKILPAVVLWGHTLSLVMLGGREVVTSVRSMLASEVSKEPAKRLLENDRAFLALLNDSAMSNADA